jgi:RNA polymerase sigma-70 factor (ECF subfamily)
MDTDIHERESLLAGCVTHESLHDVVSRVYEAERLSVYRYLASLGLEPETAKDLTQEVFLKLYVALRRGEEIRMLRPWMFRVASHLFLNVRRGETVAPHLRGDEAVRVIDAFADPGPATDETLIRRQRLQAVASAFRGLSPQQRICLRLRAEGLRYREIAEVLGVSAGTVSEFVRRALARVKKAIDG